MRGRPHSRKFRKTEAQYFRSKAGRSKLLCIALRNVRFFARVIFPAETARDCIARAKNCPDGRITRSQIVRLGNAHARP
jgi:hypothetical protein